MKDIKNLNFPDHLKYTEDHEWVKIEGNVVTIGINDYAQDQLGEVIFVELPEIGDNVNKDEEFGNVESVKSVSEVYSPVNGEVIDINQDLANTPESVNQDCYNNGWMIKVKIAEPMKLTGLLTKVDYLTKLGE